MTLEQLESLVVHHEERALELGMVTQDTASPEVATLLNDVSMLREALIASKTSDKVQHLVRRLDRVQLEAEAVLSYSAA